MPQKCDLPRDGALAPVIVGLPHAESDAAVARFLKRFLADEQPGTSWHVGCCTAGAEHVRARDAA